MSVTSRHATVEHGRRRVVVDNRLPMTSHRLDAVMLDVILIRGEVGSLIRNRKEGKLAKLADVADGCTK